MATDALPEKISMLVDFLREDPRAENISLNEVASITEVLIATMQAYFKSIDTSIYRECRSMSEYINQARYEIASLRPEDLEKSRIPSAGLELDAIVQHTEEATNTIMTSGENILAKLEGMPEEDRPAVEAAVMSIFEACSFQDITGQRISKVVETLSHVEERIRALHEVFGGDGDEYVEAQDENAEGAEKGLLSGPALVGEGIDQSEVDALLADDSQDVADAPSDTRANPEPVADEGEVAKAPAPDETIASAEEPVEEEPVPEDEPAAEDSVSEEVTAPEDSTEDAEETESRSSDAGEMQEGRTTSQEQIDALFG